MVTSISIATFCQYYLPIVLQYLILQYLNCMQSEGQSYITRQNKYSQIIESNSEFLTVVRKSTSNISPNSLQPLSQYIAKLGEVRLDYENFSQCFVQIAYFIYTSRYFQLNPEIEEKDVRIQQNSSAFEKKFSIIFYYHFSEKPRQMNSYSNIVKHIYNYLKSFYQVYEKSVKEGQLQNEGKKVVKQFFKQLAMIENKMSEIQEVGNENMRQQLFYFFLEQTDLFRHNSMLLKIKNSSMLDYLKMKNTKFKSFKEEDIKLVNEYNNEKKKSKCDIEELKKKQKSIERNIIEFFQDLEKNNPSRYKFKLETDQNYKAKFIFNLYDNHSEDFSLRLESCFLRCTQNQVLSTQIESSMQSQGNGKQKNSNLSFQIEYNSERNSVCVRLTLSSIASSSETLDFLMFQSNVLTFENGNISLEFLEEKSKQNTQQSKKNLAFRGSSCFNTKEPILQTMILLMDLTMISAKICEPQLVSQRRNLTIDKDPQKLSIIYKKMSHYTNVFLRCAKKVYSQ